RPPDQLSSRSISGRWLARGVKRDFLGWDPALSLRQVAANCSELRCKAIDRKSRIGPGVASYRADRDGRSKVAVAERSQYLLLRVEHFALELGAAEGFAVHDIERGIIGQLLACQTRRREGLDRHVDPDSSRHRAACLLAGDRRTNRLAQ